MRKRCCLEPLPKPFLFSLGVSRGDISLFERKRNEIMKGDEPLKKNCQVPVCKQSGPKSHSCLPEGWVVLSKSVRY
jgi:hypothetical protein